MAAATSALFGPIGLWTPLPLLPPLARRTTFPRLRPRPLPRPRPRPLPRPLCLAGCSAGLSLSLSLWGDADLDLDSLELSEFYKENEK